ncbi:hypothetical protein [Evansella cellulosilytica]|uniref:Uncharacterized protein n=1 Tax=Evansella cellulosilytica (strain ATCC 21833 / DSM 2522 / FERM P-1141 / JCM 9156 / N-4) TaxID=649639 RepID=E6U1H8_EVAC2|nr:hypothetical protein [Evansella cellulosilytica]ADU30341.1 hypothetical protein Bcell_2080 [Evansella cellulosilytica DSM 2522]
MEQTFKNLKDYIVAYKNGDEFVLDQLIGKRFVKEKNNQGKYDSIRYLKFNDNKLNHLYNNILNEFRAIDPKILDEYILNVVYKMIESTDITKTPAQIVTYFEKNFRLRVMDEINNANEKVDTVRERKGQCLEDDAEISHYDDFQFDVWKKNESSQYQDFIDHVGGIEKLLTKTQYKIYALKHDQLLTQGKIADDLGMSQENISKQFTRISNIIKKEWIAFKIINALKGNNETYSTILKYLEMIDNITDYTYSDYQVDNTFDFYTYTINFLKKHYKEKYDNDQNYTYGDFKEMQSNKEDISDTIIDILFDNLNQKSSNILLDEMKGVKRFLRQREKDAFVNQVNKALRQHVDYVKENINTYCVTVSKIGQ